MEASKEYFFTKLKEKLGGEVDYCCVLDGCYVFHIYHKEDLEIRSGPPIYAVCDPNHPEIWRNGGMWLDHISRSPIKKMLITP